MPFLVLIFGSLMDPMEYLLSFLKTVPPCWYRAWSNSSVSAYQLLPFLHAGIMPMCNLCLRRMAALILPISCLSKAFETILNDKFLKHLSSLNLLSDHQYEFRKGRSTGDLLAFPTDSWSSFLSRFGETFAVALDISKAFDTVLHKILLSKLPSHDVYSDLSSILSSFLSGRYIAAVVDGQCSTPKPINSGVPQGSVLSSFLFILFTIDISLTNCPIHSYPDHTTLHYSTSFVRHPNLQELQI